MNMNELDAQCNKKSHGFLKCTDKWLILLLKSDDLSQSLTKAQCVSPVRAHQLDISLCPHRCSCWSSSPKLFVFESTWLLYLQLLTPAVYTVFLLWGREVKLEVFCYHSFFIFQPRPIPVIHGNQQLSQKLNTTQSRERQTIPVGLPTTAQKRRKLFLTKAQPRIMNLSV